MRKTSYMQAQLGNLFPGGPRLDTQNETDAPWSAYDDWVGEAQIEGNESEGRFKVAVRGQKLMVG
jgi:hypothetical protein